jgi:hypothetical protein
MVGIGLTAGHEARTLRVANHVTDETTNRAFWKHYRKVMTEQ